MLTVSDGRGLILRAALPRNRRGAMHIMSRIEIPTKFYVNDVPGTKEGWMAVRGQKPLATVVKIATGNRGRRPLPRGEPVAEGTPQKPPRLSGRAAALWDEVVAHAVWLRAPDAFKLHIWCALQAEFERAPTKMIAARIGQLRALGSELGLDPSSRVRLATGQDLGPDDPAARFLGSGR